MKILILISFSLISICSYSQKAVEKQLKKSLKGNWTIIWENDSAKRNSLDTVTNISIKGFKIKLEGNYTDTVKGTKQFYSSKGKWEVRYLNKNGYGYEDSVSFSKSYTALDTIPVLIQGELGGKDFGRYFITKITPNKIYLLNGFHLYGNSTYNPPQKCWLVRK